MGDHQLSFLVIKEDHSKPCHAYLGATHGNREWPQWRCIAQPSCHRSLMLPAIVGGGSKGSSNCGDLEMEGDASRVGSECHRDYDLGSGFSTNWSKDH
jgi:hypothetical protein